MIEDVNNQKAEVKKKNGCLIRTIIGVVLILGFFGFIIYSMIDFINKTDIKWDSFDDERMERVERTLYMTMPDHVKPVWYRWQQSPGETYTRLIIEGISDPQEFLGKAFPDSEITEYTTDDYISQKFKVSSLTDEKINELQKVSPDNEKFSGIKDELNSAIKENGYSVDLTDIYLRISTDEVSEWDRYYIGFGGTSSGHCAVITFFND